MGPPCSSRSGASELVGPGRGLLRSARSRMTAQTPRAADWTSLRDEELLEQRISRLGLKLEGTALQPLVQQLYDELSQKGLSFHPPCEVGDEWFVPVGLPVIFIPFFLVHDRLRQLEKKIILEVEGETPEEFMKLIRHEAAHAYSYAYHFVRRRDWQRAFGASSKEETPSFYRPSPHSRSFVVNLADWYAQSHPDEDFAETFAIWLTPGLDWRERYKGWPALRKLEYVDALMRSLAGKPALPVPKYRAADYDCLNVKLKTYYAASGRSTSIHFRTSTTTTCGSCSTAASLTRSACGLRSTCAATGVSWKAPCPIGRTKTSTA